MSSKRLFGLAVFGAVFIALLIGASMVTAALRNKPVLITLPEQTTAESVTPDSPTGAQSGVSRVTVTRYNVRDVIATIARPAAYTRDIMVESFWRDGNAAYNISTAARENETALRVTSGGVTRSTVVSGGTLYIWYAGDRVAYSAPIADTDSAARLADEYSMLMTYEDVLALDVSSITDAGYAQYDGEDCIFVEYVSGELKYRTTCYISLKLGLLTGANEYDGETLVYKMTAGECDVSPPADELFAVPGTR